KITEIVSRDGRQEPETDVGGRSSRRNLDPQRNLIIVRRQPTGLRTDEVVKVPPGLARNPPEKPAVRGRHQVNRPSSTSLVEPPNDTGGNGPGDQIRSGGDKDLGRLNHQRGKHRNIYERACPEH